MPQASDKAKAVMAILNCFKSKGKRAGDGIKTMDLFTELYPEHQSSEISPLLSEMAEHGLIVLDKGGSVVRLLEPGFAAL